MGDRGEWLKELSKEDIWAEKLDLIPSMIVYSYKQLMDLTREGQVYGTMLLLKDIYESLLKVPLIMSLIILNGNEECKGTKEYVDVFKAALESPMSMGLWGSLALTVQRSKSLNLPEELVMILKKTRKLYEEKVTEEYPDIVCWRNGTIGHGALRFEDDLSYQKEVRALIERLKEYFDGKKGYSLTGQYEQLYFLSNGKKLTGINYEYSNDLNDIFLFSSNQLFSVEQFINNTDFRLYIFDSYNGRKGITQFCSSFDGKKQASNNQFFDTLYRRYVESEKINFDICSERITLEEDILLECLHSPFDYMKPDYLIGLLEEKIDILKKGVISIHMERGTGKSAFSNHMSGLYHRKSLIGNSFSRCYHISNARIRGVSDFINSLNTGFLLSYDMKDIVTGSQSELYSLRLETQTPSEDLSNFLNYYHRINKKEYTILVIDGIDEITEQTKVIMDFIPSKDMLDEGVFVILMSRFIDEKTVKGSSKAYISAAEKKSQTDIEIRREGKENVELMHSFVLNQDKAHFLSEEEITTLIEKSDYRFLYLKALLEVKDKVFDNSDEKAFIRDYLNYIFSFYGVAQKNQILNLVVFIALISRFSMEKYKEYFSFEELTYEFIGFINDLMPILTVVHEDGETIYELSDIAFTEYILSEYENVACELVDSLIEIMDNYIPYKHSYGLENGDIIFYAECLISIWHNSFNNKQIRDRLLYSSIIYHMNIQMGLNPYRFFEYGYGLHISIEYSTCLSEIFKYIRDNIEEIDVEKLVSVLWNRFFKVRKEAIDSFWLLNWIKKNGLLDYFEKYFYENADSLSNLDDWYWVGALSCKEKQISKIFKEKKVVKEFADITCEYLNIWFDEFFLEYFRLSDETDYTASKAFRWLDQFLECNLESEEEEYILNIYLERLLSKYNRKKYCEDYDNRISEILNLIKEKKYTINPSIKDHEFFQEKKDNETTKSFEFSRAMKCLKEQSVNEIKWDYVINVLHQYSYSEKEYKLLLEEIYSYFNKSRIEGEFNQLFEKMWGNKGNACYYLSLIIRERFEEGGLEELVELDDWACCLIDNIQIIISQSEQQEKEIFKLKLISYLFSLCIKISKENGLESELNYANLLYRNDSLIDRIEGNIFEKCADSAFYYLKVLYEKKQEKEFREHLKNIEYKIIRYLNRYGWNDAIKYYFYNFYFIRKQIGYKDELDDIIFDFLRVCNRKIDNILSSLSLHSDYYILHQNVKSILKYAWKTRDYRYGINLCEKILNKLNSINKTTDNEAFKETMEKCINQMQPIYEDLIFLQKNLEENDCIYSYIGNEGVVWEKELKICGTTPWLDRRASKNLQEGDRGLNDFEILCDIAISTTDYLFSVAFDKDTPRNTEYN